MLCASVRIALDSPGHAAPAWHRKPGQRVRRARLRRAGSTAATGCGRVGVGDPVKKLLRASTVGHRPRPRAVRAAGFPRRPCATPRRSMSPPSTRRRSGCSRPRWRGRWSRSSSAGSTPARWPAGNGRTAGALFPRLLRAGGAGGAEVASGRRSPMSWRRSTAPGGAAPRPDRQRGGAPRVAERPLIEVDLHMHTDHSTDCATPVEVLLETARDRGLGAIAITDHNEVSGALEARRIAAEHGRHQGDRRRGGEDGRAG